jgi:hypothetical protein
VALQCLGILAPLHIGGSVCELVEQGSDVREIAAAGFRQRHAPRQPLEQRDAEPVLQHLHQPPDRVGGDMEFDAGGLEAACTCGGLEGANGIERRQLALLATAHFC